MEYVVGLGNPGSRYARTRHNVGWMTLDAVAESLGAGPERKTRDGLAQQAGTVKLLKPTTYMNDSGRAVARMLKNTNAEPQNVLVVSDDLYLNLGVLRMRRAGSAGGHRGLESVIQWLGTDEFPRLKLGVGPCPPDVDARHFVLDAFRQDEQDLLGRMVEQAALAVLCWQSEGVETAMNRYNGAVE